VCSIRRHHAIPVYREGERQARGELTVSEVATILGVSSTTVLRMIRHKQLPATQVCANAPWILRKEDIDTFQAASKVSECPQTVNSNQLSLKIQ
jgi:excisionase family DNA binding protein